MRSFVVHSMPSGRGRPDWLTAANLVTYLRFLLLPVFAGVLLSDRLPLALTLLVCMGVSDFVDGFLARSLGQVTSLGTKIDPIADRLTVLVVTGGLALSHFLPWWVFAALVLPDLVLVLLVRGVDPPPVNWIGKARTVFLLIGLPLLLAGHAWNLGDVIQVGLLLVFIGTAGHLITALRYGQLILRAQQERRAEPKPPSPVGAGG
jgi:cardiolipin synthase